ncbi:MAG: DUF2153 domain-containing protein [Candidatus Bathyarchaeota archaeon]|nr:DUF2153 domain-containing protein [Candidatus Bathyarchaeota archaeon]
MSSRRVQSSKRILDRIRELGDIEEKDRLDDVRSIRFMLDALQRSLTGWMEWVNNASIMTKFTKEELEDMDEQLSRLSRSFIEYDLEVTGKGAEKELAARKGAEGRRRQGTGFFYV